jgi:hypothetical protein
MGKVVTPHKSRPARTVYTWVWVVGQLRLINAPKAYTCRPTSSKLLIKVATESDRTRYNILP